MVFFQLVVNLNYNKRKSAVDFLFGKVWDYLQSRYKDLKKVLKKDYVVFEKNDPSFLHLLNDQNMSDDEKRELRQIVTEILNFYDIWANSIYQGVYDNFICYDFQGYMAIQMYDWTKTYIEYRRLELKYDKLWESFEYLALEWKVLDSIEDKTTRTNRFDEMNKRIANRTLIR